MENSRDRFSHDGTHLISINSAMGIYKYYDRASFMVENKRLCDIPAIQIQKLFFAAAVRGSVEVTKY